MAATRLTLLGIGLILSAAGCSRAREMRDFDSDAAKRTLVAALDAWKKGQAASLERHVPPIRFIDDDLSAGLQLIGYDLRSPNRNIRFGESILVELQLRSKQGKAIQRTAAYQVALTPRLAVFRVDA